MTRGNQREINRKRAEARAAKGPKQGRKDEGESVKNRMEREAQIMREKQKAAEARKAEAQAQQQQKK